LNKLILAGIVIAVIVTIFIITLQPINQTQVPYETQTDSQIVYDETCVTNCESDDLDFDPILLTVQLPKSNDSILQQTLDNADLTTFFDVVISRQLDETVTPISELSLSESLSFITVENEFDDITDMNLSYIFEMNDVEFGSIIVEVLVNDNVVDEQNIDFTTDIVKTEPIKVNDLVDSNGENKIELRIKKLFIRSDNPYFLPLPVNIHSITLDNQPNQIIITSEIGESIKVYPEDNKLKIFQSASDIVYRKGVCQSSSGGSCYRYSYALASASPSPDVGAITVLDSTGNVIESSNFTPRGVTKTWINYIETLVPTKIIDLDLQRNSQYTIKIGSPNNVEYIIDSPKSQKNFVLDCTFYGCNWSE
jgi:hypothetical protein